MKEDSKTDLMNVVASLLDRGEGRKLDFKECLYRLDNDDLRSKFVKDLVCMANAEGAETGYIVLGVDECDDGRKALKSLSNHHKEADLQQLIENQVEPHLVFEYHPVLYEGVSLAVIVIPESDRKPHRPKKDFGILKGGIIYTRHGS